ncbi:MAG: branched-chain amino acid ABC transporter permease [Flavobacteriaceae bacterium]|nr:branched-chain amino acid ABC transporter permease [Flavobacteriaceae bacterium]
MFHQKYSFQCNAENKEFNENLINNISLCLVFLTTIQYFISVNRQMIQQLILNGIIAGSIYALIGLGFTVIYRTVKFFHFAHGIVYTAGAYLAYSIVMSLGVRSSGVESFGVGSWVVAVLGGIVGAGVLGILIDRLVYLPLRKTKAPNLVFLIASFGIFIFIQNLIQLLYGAQILTLRTGPVKEGHQFLGAVITDIQILILVVSLGVLGVLWLFVQKTKLGKAMRAVSDDPISASVVGINPEKTIFASFAIGSALAGVAGILISLETNIEPTMGFNAILKGIIASIIGGIGSIPGAMLGGFFLGIVENLGIWKIQAGWKDAIAFVVLLIFLLFRPEGILGTRKGKERL